MRLRSLPGWEARVRMCLSQSVAAPGSSSSSFNAKRLGLFADAAKSVPSLFINGNFTTTPGSTLNITVADGAAAPIIVNGFANLVAC